MTQFRLNQQQAPPSGQLAREKRPASKRGVPETSITRQPLENQLRAKVPLVKKKNSVVQVAREPEPHIDAMGA